MEKGLPGLGLREAGLKQADLQEDWLSWCVLREPCGEGPRESWHDPAGCTPSGYLGVLSAHGWKHPAYLESSCQHFQGAVPIGLPRRGRMGPEGQDRETVYRRALDICVLNTVPRPGSRDQPSIQDTWTLDDFINFVIFRTNDSHQPPPPTLSGSAP